METVSEDKKTALVFWYRERNVVNADFTRVRLQGLDPDLIYRNEYNETENYGDELMNRDCLQQIVQQVNPQVKTNHAQTMSPEFMF